MEFVKEFFWELLAGVLGVVVTMLAARAGSAVKRVLTDAKSGEGVSFLAKICVMATEQMDRALSGEEKMQRALSFFASFLEKRRIRLSEEEMRVYLESAVAEFKGALNEEMR